MIRQLASAAVLMLLVAGAANAASLPYKQKENVVFAEAHGVGLLMDVFTPTGESNGLGIVDIASGAWYSDRGKIRDHKQAKMYDIYCGKGYTVFAVRPGSRTTFTAEHMVEHVKMGIRWVKAHANEYGIDPNRIGLTGASAGGHLAALTALQSEPGNPDARDPIAKQSTEVAAVGIFFPPTNFLVWGDGKPDLNRLGAILFEGGINGRSEEEIEAQARAISPALQISGKTPPFIIWHGDADPLVPLQQSEFFVEQLKAADTDVEFYIKPGGAHPWMTIPEEVAHMSDWFDTKLGAD
jgi:acetyl esterase/lipase